MKGRRAPVPTEDVIGLIGTAVYTRVVCIETDEQGRVATNRNRLSLLSDGNEKWPVVCKRPPGKGLWSAIGFEPTACGSETILWIKSGTTDEAITIDRAIDVRACGGPVTIGLQPSVSATQGPMADGDRLAVRPFGHEPGGVLILAAEDSI